VSTLLFITDIAFLAGVLKPEKTGVFGALGAVV
jgi:hypothetical protein